MLVVSGQDWESQVENDFIFFFSSGFICQAFWGERKQMERSAFKGVSSVSKSVRGWRAGWREEHCCERGVAVSCGRPNEHLHVKRWRSIGKVALLELEIWRETQ